MSPLAFCHIMWIHFARWNLVSLQLNCKMWSFLIQDSKLTKTDLHLDDHGCAHSSFTCCISSSQTARGTAERHEGWCYSPPGNHRQDTPCCRAPANVREEHPQPIGQPGPRGHRSEPITDFTADAGAALTSHLAHVTFTDWGQSPSPHRHVADVLPLNRHVQHSQVSPCSAPTTHLRTQKSISCAAGLWFEKTGTVDVGWEWMEESLPSVAD